MKLFIDSTFGPPPLQMEFCDYGSLAAAIKRGVFTPDNSGHEPWMNLKALIATVTEMAQVREGGRGREGEGERGREVGRRGRGDDDRAIIATITEMAQVCVCVCVCVWPSTDRHRHREREGEEGLSGRREEWYGEGRTSYIMLSPSPMAWPLAVSRHPPPPPHERLPISPQGLAYLHSLDITHGDLKPSNVLLTTSRQDRRGYSVRICDFGFSRTEGAGANAG